VRISAPSRDARPSSRREFEGFYREHFGFAWRTLWRLGVASGDCEDAAQEVFVTAHRRWATIRDPEHRRAWLAGIVRRVAWRYRRGAERHARRVDAVATSQPAVLALDDEVARREAWRAVLGFLDTLDDDKRDAFVLGELEALPRPELALALGVRPSTAYSRLQVARRSFHAHFAAWDERGCARMIARSGEEIEPSREAAARAWAALLPWLGSSGVTATVPLLGKLAAALAVITVSAAAATGDVDPASHAARVPIIVASGAAPSDVPGVVSQRPPAAELPAIERVEMPAAAAIERSRLARPAPAPAPQAVVSTSDDRDAEIAVLRDARAAAVVGDLATARRHLDVHRERFGDATDLASVRASIERTVTEGLVSLSVGGDPTSQEHR